MPEFFNDISFITIITIVFFAFLAGFIDAVVGGGGLVQLPAVLISLPNAPIISIFGTNKMAAFAGTSIAAFQYSKRIKFQLFLLASISFSAALASYLGAMAVSRFDVKLLKPLILVILVAIAIFTFLKKDLGQTQTKDLNLKKQIIFGSLIALVVGFYDGFFGPGTGSFFVLGFVVILGFEFVKASAYAKFVNCITNFSAIIVFVKQGNYILPLAVLMGVSNMLGNFLGSKIALQKGNSFVRQVFLIVVSIMILRYAYDVFISN